MPSTKVCPWLHFLPVFPFPTPQSFHTMPKADYIPWSPWEVENLPRWLSQHSMLSWKSRSEAYFRQYNLPRTPEGLRSKLNQLIKPPGNPDGRLPAYHRSAARRARHRRLRDLQGFPAPSLPVRPRAPRTRTRILWQLVHGSRPSEQGLRGRCEQSSPSTILQADDIAAMPLKDSRLSLPRRDCPSEIYSSRRLEDKLTKSTCRRIRAFQSTIATTRATSIDGTTMEGNPQSR